MGAGSNCSAVALASPRSIPSLESWAEQPLESRVGGRRMVEQAVDRMHDRVVHVRRDLAYAEKPILAAWTSRRSSSAVTIRPGCPRRKPRLHLSARRRHSSRSWPRHRLDGPSTLAPAPMTTPRPSVGRFPLFQDAPRALPRAERAILADDRGLADDDAHAVVDEHPPPDRRTRMDLDGRSPSAPSGRPTAPSRADGATCDDTTSACSPG